MRKMMKKGISIILALCMLIAMVPATFAAGEGEPVTVSMLSSNFATYGINFGGNGQITDTSGYTITWNDNSAVFVREESSLGYFRQVYGLVDGKKPLVALPAGHYTTAQFTFKTEIPADGYYAVSLTPIMSQLGGTYGVYVNDQFAGSVNTWSGIEGTTGWNSNTTAGAEVSLNRLKLERDADGYVKITLKNLSTVYDSAGTTADSYKDAYTVPLGFQEFKLTPVEVATCDGISENITGKELYVGKTLDFVASAEMSDGSTFFFDSADTETNNITAEVTSGDSVELIDVAIGADGNLHGKLKGLAAAESTITFTANIGGAETTHEITVTPIAALAYEETTVSMLASGITTYGINYGGNGQITDTSGYTITWTDGKTELVKEKTKIGYFRQLYSPKPTINALPMGNYDTAQFTIRTKLADGAYKVNYTPILSPLGGYSGVWINGQYAGKVCTWSGDTTGSVSWTDKGSAGEAVALNTLNITGDAGGWVEITIKNVAAHVENTAIADSYKVYNSVPIGFANIKFTPADAPAVESLSENISTTDIYNGESYPFTIKAMMNDGNVRTFDTSDKSKNNITAEVTSGSAVELSNVTLTEDGLTGTITGAGDDEKATITVTTTINGEEYTDTINVISFATEVKTPETIVVSMLQDDELRFENLGTQYGDFDVTDATDLFWGDSDKIRYVKDESAITSLRPSSRSPKIYYVAFNIGNANSAFTVKVRATKGTYKVDLTRAYSPAGCLYEVLVGGKSVGTVDGSGKLRDTDGGTDVTVGEQISLGDVSVTPDEDGWVEISLKYSGDGEGTTVTSQTRYLLFKDITLTPTEKVYVTSDSNGSPVNDLIDCDDYTAGSVSNIAFGEKLTLTATDDEENKFVYWMNLSNNRFISDEATLEVDVTSNMSIAAVYAKAGSMRYDYFTDAGVRISSSFGTANAPAVPDRIGYTGTAEWVEDNDANFHTRENYTAYVPDYSATPKVFTVNYDDGSVEYNEKVTVSSSASGFSYWTKGDKIVSYNEEYTFFVWGGETVAPVLNGAVAAKPAVVLFSNGNEHMLELVGFDGIEVIEKGILFTPEGVTPTIGNTFAKAKSTTDSTQFAAASSIYPVARAYVIYKDAAGSYRVLYSE